MTRRAIVTLAAMLGLFLAAMDQTAVGTAMPTIVGALGGLALYSWVFAAYQIAFVVMTPIFGRLADIYGRKRIYIAGILAFIGASALCGLARSMDELVFFRLLQGIGGGAVLPIALVIIADLYPLEVRLRIQGLFSGVWGLASVIGPLVGGFLTDHVSWRWIFLLNIPAGLIATAILMLAFEEPKAPGEGRVDYAGISLLSGAAVALLLLLFWGGHEFPWDSLQTVGLIALCAVLTLMFLRVEMRTEEPFIPLNLFENRIITVATAGGFLIGVSMLGAVAYIPLFVQGVIGTSATAAGAVLTPFLVTWTFGSIIGGRTALRWGYRPTTIGGMVFLVAGFLYLTQVTAGTPALPVLVDMVVLGLGMGLTATMFIIAMQNAVERPLRGIVTSINVFTRNLGSAIGVSAQGAVLVAILDVRLGSLAGMERLGLPKIVDPEVVLDPGLQARLTPAGHEAIRVALAQALHGVFVLGLIFVALGLAAVLFMPRGSAAALASARAVPDRSGGTVPAAADRSGGTVPAEADRSDGTARPVGRHLEKGGRAR